MFNSILGGLKYAFGWLLDLLASLFRPLLNGLLSILPSWSFDTSWITGSMWALIDEWFPIQYAIGCAVSYVAIAIAVYTVNWLLGLVPSVS